MTSACIATAFLILQMMMYQYVYACMCRPFCYSHHYLKVGYMHLDIYITDCGVHVHDVVLVLRTLNLMTSTVST